MNYELFLTFFRIGLFPLGGGYAMIPLIETEVVDKRQWIDKKLFLDLIAVAQTCPGVFAINIAIFIGYRLRGIRGAICTTLGTALPSLLIILTIAMFFQNFQHIPWVAAMFAGIRPAVVALMAVPTFNMARKAQLSRYTFWIPIVSALLIWLFGVNPIYIILAAGIIGLAYGKFIHNS
jgi:chromate transporter